MRFAREPVNSPSWHVPPVEFPIYTGELWLEESDMDVNEARNAMKEWVLRDLSAICKKLADDPVVPDELRARAREMVEEFNAVAEGLVRGNATEHFEGAALLVSMARFLPRVLEVHSFSADVTGPFTGQE